MTGTPRPGSFARVSHFIAHACFAALVAATMLPGMGAAGDGPSTQNAKPLPGVWKLTKVTVHDDETLFEDGKGEYPTSGFGVDEFARMKLSYAWFIPRQVEPGEPFSASLNVAIASLWGDGGENRKNDRSTFESSLLIYESKYSQAPKHQIASPPTLGEGFAQGFQVPYECRLTDTWIAAEKYGQVGPSLGVAVCYDRKQRVHWYRYFYTYVPLETEGLGTEETPNDQNDPRVVLKLTYPAGRSPKVFTSGWLFGARCLVRQEEEEEEGAEPQDLSEEVQWSGSGTFRPAQGARSRPAFAEAGGNTIVLSIVVDGKTFTKTCRVQAVSPEKYAGVGGLARCEADAHPGPCLACPHAVVGPIRTGSGLILVRGKPAARVGDVGVHSACCGPNTFAIASGDPEVLIDGQPAARLGDITHHCGGVGRIIRTFLPGAAAVESVSEDPNLLRQQSLRDAAAEHLGTEGLPSAEAGGDRNSQRSIDTSKPVNDGTPAGLDRIEK